MKENRRDYRPLALSPHRTLFVCFGFTMAFLFGSLVSPIYITTVHTDPPAEKIVTVSDVAIEALERISGLVSRGTKQERVAACQQWWKKQQR